MFSDRSEWPGSLTFPWVYTAMTVTSHTVWRFLQVQEATFAILIKICMIFWSLFLTHCSEVLSLYLPEVIGRNNFRLSLNVYCETRASRDQLPRNIPKQTRLLACISSVVLYTHDCQFSRYPSLWVGDGTDQQTILSCWQNQRSDPDISDSKKTI